MDTDTTDGVGTVQDAAIVAQNATRIISQDELAQTHLRLKIANQKVRLQAQLAKLARQNGEEVETRRKELVLQLNALDRQEKALTGQGTSAT